MLRIRTAPPERVPGDILVVEEEDTVPVDARLIRSAVPNGEPSRQARFELRERKNQRFVASVAAR